MSTVHIKAKYEENIRRFQINPNISFKEFTDLILSVFQNTFKLDKVIFKYQDDEKDFIDLSSDDELKEAIRISTKTNGFLRINIENGTTVLQNPTIMKEVQKFLSNAVEESNKVLNQDTLKKT